MSATSAVFHRQSRSTPAMAVGGEGAYLIDRNGRRYLDASGGAAVSCLGHGNPAVRQAIHEQADRLAYAHSAFFTTEPAEELGRRLCAGAGEAFSRAYFVSGGSEANETAIKLCRQYHYERGEAARSKFIARRQSYHGNTLGALSLSGNPGRRALYAPLLLDVSHVEPCFSYRHQQAGESDADYAARAAASLEEEILRLGPETVAAFFAETVVGATAGAVPPVADYFRRVREICDRYGVLLVLDEVMAGMGRTGTLFAFQHEGIVPDLVTCAKGLGAGYQPIGAVIVKETIHQAIAAGSGAFRNGFTYNGHAIACAAANAVLAEIETKDLLERCRNLGDGLRERLHVAFGQHPHVGDIRGRGLFVGLEFVADRSTKSTFEPDAQLAANLRAIALGNGLVCYPASGTADGVRGDHVLIAPPFIIAEPALDELVGKLALSIDQAVARALGG
jgi:adenosylmethionine-8-amino-7-oxononanoate aminotransferase